MKTMLLIILAVVIVFYAGFSIWQKSNQKEKQIQMLSGQNQLNKTYTDKAGNMENYNAQAGRILNESTGGNSSDDNANPAPSASYGDDVSNIRNVNIGKNYGFAEPSQLRKLLKYSANGNTKKYNELLSSLLSNNEATAFRPGEQVILQETDASAQLVRVSRIGETQSWWTSSVTID